eukprot:1147121-Pelagomonas_calceolata.AAC.8
MQAARAAQAEALGREVQVYRERCEISARALQAAERQVESAQLAGVRDANATSVSKSECVEERGMGKVGKTVEAFAEKTAQMHKIQ